MIISFLLICCIYVLTFFFLLLCSDHAAESDAVFAEGVVPPQAAHVEEPLKAAEQMSAQQLVEGLAVAAARQAELVTQLKVQYVVEGAVSLRRMRRLLS